MSASRFASLPFPLPPLSQQERIADEVEARSSVADELEAAIDHSLRRAARLRQSILKRAFEGKLVPQDPNDEPASVLLEQIRAERSLEEVRAKSGRVRRPRSKSTRQRQPKRPRDIAEVLESFPDGLPVEELLDTCGYGADEAEEFYLSLKSALEHGIVEEARSQERAMFRLASK